MIDGCEELFNKEIEEVHCDEQSLIFKFKDGSQYEIEDHAQSCCEHRYMNTDDCLSEFKDSKFISAKIEDGPSVDIKDDWNEKDSQFLIVTTSKGQFTVVNYNEHNGYYGGFCVELRKIK